MKKRSSTWRSFVDPDYANFEKNYDAVIVGTSQGRGGRGNAFEVYTYGTLIATRESLADAKKEVEMVYGPLQWQRIKMPLVEVEHAYFGPMTSFTDPLNIYVIDRLPQL